MFAAPAVSLILRLFKDVIPPSTLSIVIFPPSVVISKSRAVLSEFTVAVLLRVTVVFAASASIVVCASKVTGPVIVTAPPAELEVVISPQA